MRPGAPSCRKRARGRDSLLSHLPQRLLTSILRVPDVVAGLGRPRRLWATVSDVRYFNTTGPCDPALHYMLPASARLPRARQLMEEGRYFVVHAPRQTGKTTTVTALAREVTAAGRHAALRISIEAVGPLGEEIAS